MANPYGERVNPWQNATSLQEQGARRVGNGKGAYGLTKRPEGATQERIGPADARPTMASHSEEFSCSPKQLTVQPLRITASAAIRQHLQAGAQGPTAASRDFGSTRGRVQEGSGPAAKGAGPHTTMDGASSGSARHTSGCLVGGGGTPAEHQNSDLPAGCHKKPPSKDCRTSPAMTMGPSLMHAPTNDEKLSQ